MTRSSRVLLPLTTLLALSGCQSAAELLFEPAPTDPYDGYDGSYAQAGVSTEMDYGPKQSKLLEQYNTLFTEKAKLDAELKELRAKNQNLNAQLEDEKERHELARGERAQIEDGLRLARQRLHEQETTILALRIEKAKAEQQALLLEIDLAEASLEKFSTGTTEATAMPPANR